MTIEPMSIHLPEGDELPQETVPYFAPTSKGWMVNVPTLFGVAHIKGKVPEHLKEYEELFHFNDRKLPVHIIEQAHDFFRQVWHKQKTESSVYILQHPVTNDYKMYVPEQYVTKVSVNHKMEPGEIQHGYRAIGTIHSHCDFGAFHSGTDDHDMKKMPGLHITIGHVDQDVPEFAFALSVNGVRFDIKREDIIDEEVKVDKNGYNTCPEWVLRFVHTGVAPWGNTGKTTTYKPPTAYKSFTPNTNHTYSGHWSDWSAEAMNGNMQNLQKWQQDRIHRAAQSETAHEAAADELEMTEDVINYECVRMAELGFRLQYTITYSPTAAEAWLQQHGPDTQMELPEVFDGTN